MKIANGHAYGDSDWHDLLTELNGTPIVYEGQTYVPETNEVGGSILSGNPEYYNGWNFDWQRGRELASAEQNDGTTNTALTYAYDADGIRTSKTYTVKTQHTVTFVADGTTVKTMTVADGYTLKTSDYPTVPAKSGYTGSWNKYTEAIHANITIEAVYQEITDCTVRFVAERIILKTMTVKVGYTLKDFDYPTIPQKARYTAAWSPHSRKITKNTIITVKYTKTGGGGGITVPTIRPSYSDVISDLPEPIEPQDVGEPDDTTNASDATGNIAETQASHPGQTLVSTQTVSHEYLTLNGKVVRETVKVNGSVTEILDFLYDESGRPFALNYSTNGGSSFITYYYILNLQGDVVKLVTSSGSAVATYEYDAWGNVLSKSGTMADKNPLRYRGYYYDNETGFYYLQSRYYDPAMKRFINADAYSSTGQGFIGTNMFAYCSNSPVNKADSCGHFGEIVISVIDELRLWLTEISTAFPPAVIAVAVVVLAEVLLDLSVAYEDLREDLAKSIIGHIESVEIHPEKAYNNSVYLLRDSQKIVRYVGRTNEPDRRLNEHRHNKKTNRSNYTMHIIATGLTKDEARVLEQVVISAYTISYLENARREIGKGNLSNFRKYLSAASDVLCGAAEEALFSLMGR